ncbi:HTH-type transcriptional regulator LeuO [Pseudomonas fluorescens]|uniref:HTH-type transcriptional regulator LeuO n=1 Tax=Pseudomonas fluorescens TaxID=294 RepID=A0A5E7GKM4_PSEFL|nr:LysR family transcriptional regulator [Pseudomonas fluorescens]VVM71580.1 HTH-type transcriptional regulator LeuO [Pseudomonas fluorescens]VVO52285.1 HTH-type transcriptional regulator LeuO [Pseudomonas fluorescens]
MNRNDLRRVDMNLLVIFETLMFEKNLTRSGEKLLLGQPAVSASLAKLRDLFDDPLLVRNGRALEPTQRALQILQELQPAMDTISGAVSRAKDFDPSTSRDVFRIGLSEPSMVWNGVNDNDPAERWLRSKIEQHMAAPLPAH